MARMASNGENWYKVIIATRKEFMAVRDDVCECHLCGDGVNLDEEMYYIPVLDVVYCHRCYELWCLSAQFYKVDKPIEQRNLDVITKKFEELDCWEK